MHATYCAQGDGVKRMVYVAGFAASAYASTKGRSCKPFNPLLGETYEADYPDKGIRFISEKVQLYISIILLMKNATCTRPFYLLEKIIYTVKDPPLDSTSLIRQFLLLKGNPSCHDGTCVCVCIYIYILRFLFLKKYE